MDPDNGIKENLHAHAIRIALLEQATLNISNELKILNEHVSKLIWVVIAAVIVSVTQFLLKGGLNV